MENMKVPDKKAMEQAMRFAQSEAGRKLIDSLRQSNDPGIKRAMEGSASGDPEKIRQSIETLLASPQMRALLSSLGDSHG